MKEDPTLIFLRVKLSRVWFCSNTGYSEHGFSLSYTCLPNITALPYYYKKITFFVILCGPSNQRVASSVPSWGTGLDCGPGPQWGVRERGSHTLMFLSLP